MHIRGGEWHERKVLMLTVGHVLRDVAADFRAWSTALGDLCGTASGEVTTSTATSTYAALARHLLHVANAQVRNAASWAGNVMLASHHKDFPSDVTMVCAKLIGSCAL